MSYYMVGFGRTDCTPDFTVSLAGYGNYGYRLNRTVRDHVYASCVAVTDEAGATLLLYGTDNMNLPNIVIDPVIVTIC